jgi:hypothetical protein
LAPQRDVRRTSTKRASPLDKQKGAQGSQFTSFAFTTTLKDAGVRVSMGGRGRWMDNVFIEPLWRNLKYECVFLSAFGTGSEARSGIGSWIDYCNRRRPHSTFARRSLCHGGNDGAIGSVDRTLSTLAKLPNCFTRRVHLSVGRIK